MAAINPRQQHPERVVCGRPGPPQQQQGGVDHTAPWVRCGRREYNEVQPLNQGEIEARGSRKGMTV